MPKTATHHDAELILRLFELRREAEMRKARHFVGFSVWPNTFAEFEDAFMNPAKAQENAWFRQVTSFWEMAANLVVHGTINEALFIDNSGEMFFVFAKLKPFLAEWRKKFDMPDILKNVETIASGKSGKAKLAAFEKRVAMVKQRFASKAAKA